MKKNSIGKTVRKSMARPVAAKSRSGNDPGGRPAGGTACCEPRKALLLKRLSRIEGQIRGISRMVEEDRYCIDVLTQMAAVHEALRSAGREILENHMHTCVAEALTSGDAKEADRVSQELGTLLTRLSR